MDYGKGRYWDGGAGAGRYHSFNVCVGADEVGNIDGYVSYNKNQKKNGVGEGRGDEIHVKENENADEVSRYGANEDVNGNVDEKVDG